MMSAHPSRGSAAPRAKLFWIGWALTLLPALFLLFAAVNSLLLTDQVRQGLAEMGYPESTARPIGAVLLVSVALYLLPRTAILGAILLTGYLGGAVATHVRAGDPLALTLVPVLFGVVIWLGPFCRDARVRALTPWRTIPTHQPVNAPRPADRSPA